MVSVTGICGTLLTLCATMNSVPSEEVVAQISYDTVDSKEQIIEMVENGIDPYSPRELLSKNTQDIIKGYFEYEEQRRIEEMKRQLEEEMARIKAIEEQYPYKEYRQTYYSVIENNETNLGAGYSYRDNNIKVIDNVMNFYDKEYGYLPVYAIDMNEVLNSGLNQKGTPNVYGSIIELTNGNKTWLGIVLDACGECRYSKRLDLWVYQNQQSLDVSNIDFRYVRYGWNNEEQYHG